VDQRTGAGRGPVDDRLRAEHRSVGVEVLDGQGVGPGRRRPFGALVELRRGPGHRAPPGDGPDHGQYSGETGSLAHDQTPRYEARICSSPSSSDSPTNWTRPLLRMYTKSASSRARATYCSTSSNAAPWFASRCRYSKISSMILGARPIDTSSSSTVFAPAT